MAERAELHELYEEAVQAVEPEVEFLRDTFKTLRGRAALSFREDFCGTASAACEWVRKTPKGFAIGVDNDPEVLEWGRTNRLSRLPEVDRARVKLLEDDVRTVVTDPVDIVGAFNFSYFMFETRDELRNYFARAREALNADGVLFLDAFGGPESVTEQKDKTKFDDLLHLGPGQFRARHPAHHLPHPLQVSGRLEAEECVYLRVADVDAAGAARAAARGGLCFGTRVLGRRGRGRRG